jgi:hypothetical protein
VCSSEQAAGIREDQMVVLPQDILICRTPKTNIDSEEGPQAEMEQHSSIAMLPLMVDDFSKSSPVSLHQPRGDSAPSEVFGKVRLTSASHAPLSGSPFASFVTAFQCE